MRATFAVAFGILLLAASASAESVRFPETGDPAFVIETPDGWTHKPDGDGNMLLVAGDTSASYSLTLSTYSDSLDALADAAMKVAGGEPPQKMGPTKVSGFRGYAYDSELANQAGVKINTHLVIVKLDASHVASMTRLTIENISPEDFAAADSIFAHTTITAVPHHGRRHR